MNNGSVLLSQVRGGVTRGEGRGTFDCSCTLGPGAIMSPQHDEQHPLRCVCAIALTQVAAFCFITFDDGTVVTQAADYRAVLETGAVFKKKLGHEKKCALSIVVVVLVAVFVGVCVSEYVSVVGLMRHRCRYQDKRFVYVDFEKRTLHWAKGARLASGDARRGHKQRSSGRNAEGRVGEVVLSERPGCRTAGGTSHCELRVCPEGLCSSSRAERSVCLYATGHEIPFIQFASLCLSIFKADKMKLGESLDLQVSVCV